MKNKTLAIVLFFWIQIIGLFHTHDIQGQPLTSNGYPFTPKGDLRVIIIFAGIQSDCDINNPEYNDINWPQEQSGFPTCKTLPLHYDEFLYSDYSSFNPNATDKTMSNLYYQASRHHPTNPPFRIVGDIFPERINVTEKNSSLVFDKINMLYPNFDWSRYDNRTNLPKFNYDYSISPPDHEIDFVIIIWRDPGGAGGYSSLDGSYNLTTNINGYPELYTIRSACGFTHSSGTSILKDVIDIFGHEMDHCIFNSPHFNGANGTIGNYFAVPSFDYGLIGSALSINSPNAWEKWVQGWIEIKHDLSTYSENGTYNLRDHITTGDVIRIKIPNTTSQYLWIENHQQLSVFDHKKWAGNLNQNPPGNSGIPDIEAGIYMYIEDIASSRSAITSPILSLTNGIKFLNAQGNFDYEKPTTYTENPSEYWGNRLYIFKKEQANPMSGTNNYFKYRNDFNNNNIIENCWNLETNTSSIWPANGCIYNDDVEIIKEIINGVPKLLYGNLGGRNNLAIAAGRRSDAFQIADTIYIGSNPPIVNYRKYSINAERLESIYLNGLSLIITEGLNNSLNIDVKFNETDLSNDVRWCGDLVLSDVPGVPSNYDLNIKSGKTLTLNESGIPNRHTLRNGKFTNPTTFTVASNSYLNLENNAKIVSEASLFTIENGGIVELKAGAKIISTNNSLLHIKSGGTLILNSNSEVIANTNAKICIESGALIIFNDVTASIKIDNEMLYGSIDPIITSNLNISNIPIPIGLSKSENITINNASFTTGKVILRASKSITFDTTTTIEPLSGNLLNAVITSNNFTNDCSTNSNFRIVNIDQSEFKDPKSNYIEEIIEEDDDEKILVLSKIIYYPNPTNNKINITKIDKSDIISYEIKISNLVGSTFNIPYLLNNKTIELDLTSLEQGTYIINSVIDNNVSTFKVIKTK